MLLYAQVEVEYGRAIYDNLSNFIRFQITTLVAFIVSYLGAAFFVIAAGVPFTSFVVLSLFLALALLLVDEVIKFFLVQTSGISSNKLFKKGDDSCAVRF